MQKISSHVCMVGIAKQSLLFAFVGFSRELHKLVGGLHVGYMYFTFPVTVMWCASLRYM